MYKDASERLRKTKRRMRTEPEREILSRCLEYSILWVETLSYMQVAVAFVYITTSYPFTEVGRKFV